MKQFLIILIKWMDEHFSTDENLRNENINKKLMYQNLAFCFHSFLLNLGKNFTDKKFYGIK